MKTYETIHCHGHTNIRGTHPTTFEVTKEKHLTLQGDCIVGVGADKGAADLNPLFIQSLCSEHSVLLTTLRAGTIETHIHSRGSARLTLTHPQDLVWRKSTFIDERTVGIRSDRVAATLPRELILLLRDGEDLVVEMTVTYG